MKIFSIRATQEVVRKGADLSGTRRRTVQSSTGPRVLTFGKVPVYVACDELPPAIAEDIFLIALPVDTVPDGGEVIDLKAERVQTERVKEPAAARATTKKAGKK